MMKQETLTQQIIDEVQFYNSRWKQDVVLSDCEDQYAKVVSEDEKEYTTLLYLGKALDIQPGDSSITSEILNYLDAPQLKMSTLQSPKNVINYFVPNDFVSTLTEMINKYLMAALQQDKQQTQQTQQLYNKKKYKDSEIQFYLGLQILFGMYRFPCLDEYWSSEAWLRGGIEVCMPIGRLKFVDMYICSYDEEQQRAALSIELKKLKQKITALYNPDQELIITQQIYKAYTTYYIFDSESSQIVDLLVISNSVDQEEKLNRLVRMLFKYANSNHVMYFMFEVKVEKIIQFVDQQIYPVIYYKNVQNNLIQTLQDGDYTLDQLFLMKKGTEVYIFPQKRLISHKHYVSTYRSIQELVSEQLLNIHQFRSNFYFSSQLNNSEGYQQLRVEFEEYFEVMIYNTSLLLQFQTYKSYRQELAKIFLGEKGSQIDRERREAKRKLTVSYMEAQVNTEQLDFGLQNQYGSAYHTPYPQRQDETFKFCLVCMKFEGLTKPYYRCNLCEKLLKQSKIFLCPFPCFELFHRNPSDFITCDMQALSNQGEGKYFKNESTLPLVTGSQDDEASSKKKKQHRPPPRPFWSYNKEIYKQANVNDDKNLNEILSTFKKTPIAPSPNLLQPILPSESQQLRDQQCDISHKNDLRDFEERLNYDKEQKERTMREMEEKERAIHEQILQKQYERQLQEEQENKKSKKVQKELNKKKQLEEQLKNVSPLETFMENIHRRTKLEDDEQ